ncbi:MAG: mammalian cell entry protein [Betaproteobacteria bacterium]|nr:mammalian cell entry protein [Betaproteobacteria bacterium]
MSAEREPGVTHMPKNLEFKVRLLLVATIATAIAFVLYVMYARGVFEPTQHLTLKAENAEGMSVGMELTFSYSGFAIGRVQRIALAEDGNVRVEIVVPRKEARWLRKSSTFKFERLLVGGGKIRAFTNIPEDPPLEDGQEFLLNRGDATEDLPAMIGTMKSVLENVEQMTAAGGSLEASVANVRTITGRMAGSQGALGGVLGSEDNAKKVIAAIDRANALLASLGGVALKIDGVIGKADQRVFGTGGVMDETQKSVVQAGAILGEVRQSLTKVDAILADAQAVGRDARVVSANVKAASADLAVLRAEVEASLRKVAQLIDEINRKWPLERDTGIKLP